ncbi:MAG: phosphofructokinase [Candidatus Marinimicrobia bacterium CG08_land_8_20_14_0_20_45_22]|nr:MAG: phosphofructokinase [Candidatus Marinimicrobia bacterium CG08_land_8_20_14_0_20_45_22]
MKGNALVAQAGGPTTVINSSLSGIITQCLKENAIENVYGCHWGMLGLMNEDFVDLGKEDKTVIEGLKRTPSSALGSSRYKLSDKDMPKVLEILKKHNVRYFFGIGGNDTMLNVYQVEKYCHKHDYELYGMGCPKTVDNDLFGTDHTPGFPTAARFVALSVLQAGILSRDMQKVDQFVIYQTIGRDAGWLAASAFAVKSAESDPPHIILLPEVPFDEEKFFAKFEETYRKFGFVSIICGEGIVNADGTPVSASKTKDNFSNVEFGAMGGASAAMMLHRMLTNKYGYRGEFQVPESLPMCSADRAVENDIEEAFMLGQEAVKFAVNKTSGLMTTIERTSNAPYQIKIGTIQLEKVAAKTKPIPKEFIAEDGMMMTESFNEYIKPLIGELPKYVKLNFYPVK